ncbi:hypothetical protein [Nonomuraea sp. SYSU D8015]|nr:hypothetical protein [Nonomuraea sp. SYSU D8015]
MTAGMSDGGYSPNVLLPLSAQLMEPVKRLAIALKGAAEVELTRRFA